LDTREILVSQLADGAYHSGEALGDRLGMSRAAVWKQLRKLVEWGIEVESCRRRGYRIPGGLSLLDVARIRPQLTEEAVLVLDRIEVHQQLDSTNALAMQNTQRGPSSGSVFLAEYQSAGKGRRGRNWVSPYGRNIYMSAVQGFNRGVAAAEGLSLAVGVAVVKSLTAMGCSELGLKWPNDILWSGRKLGGILLEISGDPAGVCEVVVGIGINVQMSAREGTAVDQAWVNLSEISGQLLDRNAVVANILNDLLPMLASYEQCGFRHYRDAWEALDCYGDEMVTLVAGDASTSGRTRGVTDGGALRIETPDGIQIFSGGEMSLRQGP
jgi:BirA family biotin operon repressor/biotin-[acetyl-CoA-carboxylase] ligase